MSLHPITEQGPHKVGYALCDCGFKAVVACPVETDDQALECDACGSRRLQFVSRDSFRRGIRPPTPLFGGRA